MRVISLKIEDELLERLDSLARLMGISRSEAIRRAIEMYVNSEESRARPKPKIVRLNC